MGKAHLLRAGDTIRHIHTHTPSTRKAQGKPHEDTYKCSGPGQTPVPSRPTTGLSTPSLNTPMCTARAAGSGRATSARAPIPAPALPASAGGPTSFPPALHLPTHPPPHQPGTSLGTAEAAATGLLLEPSPAWRAAETPCPEPRLSPCTRAASQSTGQCGTQQVRPLASTKGKGPPGLCQGVTRDGAGVDRSVPLFSE